MKRKIFVTKDGQLCTVVTEKEAKAVLGINALFRYHTIENRLSECGLDSEIAIHQAFLDSATVVADLGYVPSVLSGFDESEKTTNYNQTRAFAELCSLVTIERVQIIQCVEREDAVDTLYKWSEEFLDWMDKDADENEYLDYIKAFASYKIHEVLQVQEEHFVWNRQSIINLQYIMSLNPDADLGQDFDALRLIAIEFSLWERVHYSNYDYNENGNDDYESVITGWYNKRQKTMRLTR